MRHAIAMLRFLAVSLLAFQLVSLSAFSATVTPTWYFYKANGTNMGSKPVKITPIAKMTVNGWTNIVAEPLPGFTTNGIYSTTLFNGLAVRVELSGYDLWTQTNYFGTNITGAVNAADYTALSTNLGNGIYAYSMAQADARFVNITNGGTGTTYTNNSAIQGAGVIVGSGIGTNVTLAQLPSAVVTNGQYNFSLSYITNGTLIFSGGYDTQYNSTFLEISNNGNNANYDRIEIIGSAGGNSLKILRNDLEWGNDAKIGNVGVNKLWRYNPAGLGLPDPSPEIDFSSPAGDLNINFADKSILIMTNQLMELDLINYTFFGDQDTNFFYTNIFRVDTNGVSTTAKFIGNGYALTNLQTTNLVGPITTPQLVASNLVTYALTNLVATNAAGITRQGNNQVAVSTNYDALGAATASTNGLPSKVWTLGNLSQSNYISGTSQTNVTFVASTFSGNGSGLTNLNGYFTNITIPSSGSLTVSNLISIGGSVVQIGVGAQFYAPDSFWTTTILRNGSTSVVGWSSGGGIATTADTGMSRLAAGRIAFGNGSANSIAGTLVASNFTASTTITATNGFASYATNATASVCLNTSATAITNKLAVNVEVIFTVTAGTVGFFNSAGIYEGGLTAATTTLAKILKPNGVITNTSGTLTVNAAGAL